MTRWNNHLLFTKAVKAARLLKENKKLFIYIMLADLIFILVNGFLSLNLIVRLQEYLFSAAGEIAERSAEITQELIHRSIFEVLFSYPEISSLMYSIFGVLLLLAITVYIVFSVFQGYAWKTTLKILGRKMSRATPAPAHNQGERKKRRDEVIKTPTTSPATKKTIVYLVIIPRPIAVPMISLLLPLFIVHFAKVCRYREKFVNIHRR